MRADLPTRKIEITSTEGFFSLTWSPDAFPEAITYANDLLRSLMNLPADEIPDRPRSTTGLLASVAELADEVG